MCNDWCFDWIQRALEYWPENAHVLEVGARDVNGSARALVEERCASYIGVDIEAGPGVDQIADAERLLEVFERDRFDALLCTETVEHVRNWPAAFSQMMAALKPGGILVLTTRSPGFEQHGFPYDHWRYTRNDIAAILADAAETLALDDDLSYGYPCGVGVIARKQGAFIDENVWLARLRSDISLFHIRLGGRLSFTQYEAIESASTRDDIDPTEFPESYSAPSMVDWRMMQASRADIMGVVTTEGELLLVAPCDPHQSRVLAKNAGLRLFNPGESMYEITLEITQLSPNLPRLTCCDDEYIPLAIEPIGYHHRFRFEELLLPPGKHRLTIRASEPEHALTRIHFDARTVSPAEAAWRTSPTRKNARKAWQEAINQRDRRIEELQARAAQLEEALTAEQRHRGSVQEHARNVEILLKEAEKEAANYKALTAELTKHASNLEEQIQHHRRHIEALLAQIQRVEGRASNSGGSSTQAISDA